MGSSHYGVRLHILFVIAAISLSVAAYGADKEVALGPFILDHSLAAKGWRPESPRAVWPVLEREGLEEPATFLIVSPAGSRIYGMFWESPDLAITAEKILPNALPAEWFRDWGLDEKRVSARLARLPAGADMVRIDATGAGNGLWFEKASIGRTVASWVLVPVVFERGGDLHSGIVRLFFRTTAENESVDRQAFQSLLDGLSILPSTRLRSRRDFYIYLAGNWRRAEVEAAEKKPSQIKAGSEDSRPQEPGQWTRAVRIALSTDETSRSEKLILLKRLAVDFPANPYLEEKLGSLEPEVREQKIVAELLAADADGSKAQELRMFHETILDEIRQGSGLTKVVGYLAYLDHVWPGNPVRSPPIGEAQRDQRWRDPLLGIEMVRIELVGEGGFWITNAPVRELLTKSVGGLAFSASTTVREVLEIAESFGFSLPTIDQYRRAVDILEVEAASWIAWEKGALRVNLSGGKSTESRRVRDGAKLKASDFLMVLEEI